MANFVDFFALFCYTRSFKMKKIWLILAWTSFATLLLFVNGVAIHFLLTKNSTSQNIIGSKNESLVANSLKPGEVKGVTTEVGSDDARIQLVANFLRRHNSPLDPDEYGRKFVAIADRYNIDFRLVPAIAMTESNLCKSIPDGTYNCTGFGITGSGKLGFQSYEENFDATAKSLKKNYIDEGLTSPSDIMRKYTPPSDGSWQNSVNQWMAEMRYDDHSKGIDMKTDANVMEFANQASSSASTSAAAPN